MLVLVLANTSYAIHEVFYDDRGNVTSWTENPINIVGHAQKEILDTLKSMAKDVDTPILIESEILKVNSAIFRKLKLVKTSDAFPEQYDVFLNKKSVGYLRLRNSTFRVDYPECGGETIYEAQPEGYGSFTNSERDSFLTKAKLAIQEKIVKESS